MYYLMFCHRTNKSTQIHNEN